MLERGILVIRVELSVVTDKSNLQNGLTHFARTRMWVSESSALCIEAGELLGRHPASVSV
jgi:hypothetical protein